MALRIALSQDFHRQGGTITREAPENGCPDCMRGRRAQASMRKYERHGGNVRSSRASLSIFMKKSVASVPITVKGEMVWCAGVAWHGYMGIYGREGSREGRNR